MIKVYLQFVLFYIFFYLNVNAQKPIIDSTAIRQWPRLGLPAITNDGMYALYSVDNKPVGLTTLIIMDINNSWREEFVGPSFGFFSYDSKKVAFLKSDSLYVLNLGSDSVKTIPNIKPNSFQVSNNGRWLIYGDARGFVIHNLITGTEMILHDASDYLFDETGDVLLVKREVRDKNNCTTNLEWINLDSGARTIIFSLNASLNEAEIGACVFDKSSTQISFWVNEKKGSKIQRKSIWYYKIGMDKASLLVDEQNCGLAPNFKISNRPIKFSHGGQFLFLGLQKTEFNKDSIAKAVNVDVWSYKDVVLQSVQLASKQVEIYNAAVKIEGGGVIQIEYPGEQMVYSLENGEFAMNDSFVITSFRNPEAQWWNKIEQKAFYLVSLLDGSKRLIRKGEISNICFSPFGKYLVYFDPKAKSYFSYDILKSKSNNIAKGVTVNLISDKYDDYPRDTRRNSIGICAWLQDDSSILVYDNYDIWKLFPFKKHSGINITNGYGRINKVKFRLLNSTVSDVISQNDLFLTAYDVLTKMNGFYVKNVKTKGNPVKIDMGKYNVYIEDSQLPNWTARFSEPMRPMKAKNSDTWLVKRMSAISAPNYYATKNFKEYTPLSNIQPQKAYNWLTAELINYKKSNGTLVQGILYKPENFDRKKVYPIIFNFYEQLTYRLYEFPQPDFMSDNINIPWFVSQGYLVFTPDIHYEVGKTGYSAYDAVISAVRYFSNFKFIDLKRMGVQGHSFGGFETSYLVTHTKAFAAAVEAAGITDHIRDYGTLRLNGTDHQAVIELNHRRLGKTFWQKPDVFLDNSPFMQIGGISTPLLIMHNKNDGAVPWDQGVSFFLGLRRLEKRAWMLQYDNGRHSVYGKDAVDYSIRVNQFFNHYLKNELPPKWMTKGIPAKVKGFETGYELDSEGKCGSQCLVCSKKDKSVKAAKLSN
jgi:dipeptidyl aminopeptidase/acylaminoacyl peptidase